MAATNWAGNYTYRARAVHAPSTVEQVQELVAAKPRVRVLGSRHSFSDIADSDELLTLEGIPGDVVVDRDAMTVAFGGAVRYGDLALELAREGLALANLASLPHISIAGAVSTATHGSGDRVGNLATAVAALEIVTSDGNVVTAARGDPDFDGLVVGLGAVGAVTRVTLDVEPAYEVCQRVFEGLRWDDLFEHFDAITSTGYSVSVFTRWGETIDQVWIKSRAGEESEAAAGVLLSARAATQHRHPILGLDPVNCTPQLGIAGAVGRAPASFPDGLHAERRRRAPVRVPRPQAARGGRGGGRARHLGRDPSGAPGQRDPDDRGRSAVDEPGVRPGHGRDPLHVEPRAGRPCGRALAAARGDARPV